MKSIYNQLCAFLRILYPSNKPERFVLIGLLLYFCSISIPFCLGVQPEQLGMLGYDTAGHLTVPSMKISLENCLSWNLRHPLYRLMYLPFIIINEGLLLIGIDITWPLFASSTIILMSLSGLYIFKALRLLCLSIRDSIILLVMFCSFAHTIMLSIQVDSFNMSMFWGSIVVLLIVSGIRNNVTDNLVFLGFAGTTSTNFIKVVYYHLIEERSIKRTCNRLIKSIPLFCILFILTIPNLCSRIAERPRGLLYAIMGDSFSFQGTDVNKWQLFIDNFLCDPILFHHTDGIIYSHETTHLPPYPTPLFYIPITIIFMMVVISIIQNHRHHLIQFFCCSFGFDILMHFGIGYGMEEAQLFCGHWLFFLPILLGMFIKNLSTNKYLTTLIALVTMFLLIYNIFCYYYSL